MSAEQPRVDLDRPRADSERVDRLIGQVLANRYRIEHRLGEGAMGSVYKARHIKVGRAFAVKILHPRLLDDDKVLRRFEREAELAGRLRHPNVIGVVDVGETSDGLRYMVMDFVEGPDMSALLGESPMPPPRVINLVRQLLEGLFHAHTAGLIHRDFKPENVIVERDSHGHEVPRIVDFGIAILREGGESSTGPGRLTTNGLVLGTPHYMAPEQAVNDPIDHRIDLFALGIMIYEMLCGKLPFDGNGAEVARANLLLDPPPISTRVPYLEVDPLLEAFARRLMTKNRDARPATAKVARDLLDLVERDREAAAVALGVSPAVSRSPRMTEDATPQPRHDGAGNDTFPPVTRAMLQTPPQAPPMAGAVARLDHEQPLTPPPPVMQPTPPPMTALAPAPTGEEKRVPTEDAAPLAYVDEDEVARKRRRLIVIIGAAALTIAIVVGVAIFSAGKSAPPPAPRPPVVAIEPPVTPPPVEVQPQPVHEDPPPVGSAALVPPVPPAPPPVTPAHVAHPVHGQPATPSLAKSGATQTDAATKPATPAPSGAYDATAFIAQYNAVDNELVGYAASHPGGVSDLQSRITRIEINSALGSQAARDAARAILDKIHSDFVARSKH